MRIAQIAPPSLTVPPQGYGGIELVVALLADGLVDRGHEVTLFASGGSRSRARLVSPLPRAPGTENTDAPLEFSHALEAYAQASEFDLIHDHTIFGPAVGAMLGGSPPIVHTLHGPWTASIRKYYGLLHERVNLVAISKAQSADNPEVHYAGVVYNGIDLGAYPFCADKEDYLAFVGRSTPEKGPELAVEIAKRAAIPLKMAVKIAEPEERSYWEREVVPRMSGEEEVHENLSHEGKVDLLGRARATLFPIQWSEPFGLVMIESMACGTPVIACPRGAALELVDDGVTGFFREEVDEMVEVLDRIDEISPEACRARVAESFSADSMIFGYEEIFRRVGRLTGAAAGSL